MSTSRKLKIFAITASLDARHDGDRGDPVGLRRSVHADGDAVDGSDADVHGQRQSEHARRLAAAAEHAAGEERDAFVSALYRHDAVGDRDDRDHHDEHTPADDVDDSAIGLAAGFVIGQEAQVGRVGSFGVDQGSEGRGEQRRLDDDDRHQACFEAARAGVEEWRPDAGQSDVLVRSAWSRAAGRAELLHRELPDPAVPAADLPGGGDRVRRAVAGAGGDQRDRDRLRAELVGIERGRGRVDAVHPVDVEEIRRGRDRLGIRGSVQPRRRDLRRGALPARGGRVAESSERDLRV